MISVDYPQASRGEARRAILRWGVLHLLVLAALLTVAIVPPLLLSSWLDYTFATYFPGMILLFVVQVSTWTLALRPPDAVIGETGTMPQLTQLVRTAIVVAAKWQVPGWVAIGIAGVLVLNPTDSDGAISAAGSVGEFLLGFGKYTLSLR